VPRPEVVELRQYTLQPGRRDDLIEIFERHLIAGQEEAGARIIGHFRDLEEPDRFVWLRSFRDMPSRRLALEAFYGGGVWREHRDAVNEMIVDHENVLLLRPATGDELRSERVSDRRGLVTATIWPLAEPVSIETTRLVTDEIAAILNRNGATPAALLVTEPSENTYPRLAIREGENVVVWLARFDDAAALETHAAALVWSQSWSELMRSLDDRLAGPPQTLRLAPA
jgi:quinol monooxygenase YgiN